MLFMFCLQIFYKPDNINGKFHGKRFQFGFCHMLSPFTGSIAQKVIVLHACPPSSHEVRITHKKGQSVGLAVCTGFALLRQSHGGCSLPPAGCQEPPFESVLPHHKKGQSVGLVFFVAIADKIDAVDFRIETEKHEKILCRNDFLRFDTWIFSGFY